MIIIQWFLEIEIIIIQFNKKFWVLHKKLINLTFSWVIMEEKEWKSSNKIYKFNKFRDATILGTTVYNSVYLAKIPSVIIKDLYTRK